MASMIHLNQIHTSSNLASCLLERQYPSLSGKQIGDTPLTGTDSAIYRVGKGHSVRLPIIHWAVGKQEIIRPWLNWIDENISIHVPSPVYFGSPDCGYPHQWTIYPWIEGETLAFGVDDTGVTQQIADFLREVRSLPTCNAPVAGRSPHVLDADVRKCLDQLLPDDRPDELKHIWEQMMKAPVWDDAAPAWMHGDVAPGNLLFREGLMVAAIDWTELGVGDPASDLQVAWNMLVGNARAAFREAMEVDEQTWEHARARAFGQASFQLPYYRDSLPILGNQASHVFREIRAEFGYLD